MANRMYWIMQHLWLIPAQSVLWMYLTSMFVHAGIFHLLGNMIFLFLFGSCVEDLIGRLRFAIFYLVGGLVAELVYIAMIAGTFRFHHADGRRVGRHQRVHGHVSAAARRRGHRVQIFFLVLSSCKAGEFEVPAWMAIIF